MAFNHSKTSTTATTTARKKLDMDIIFCRHSHKKGLGHTIKIKKGQKGGGGEMSVTHGCESRL